MTWASAWVSVLWRDLWIKPYNPHDPILAIAELTADDSTTFLTADDGVTVLTQPLYLAADDFLTFLVADDGITVLTNG